MLAIRANWVERVLAAAAILAVLAAACLAVAYAGQLPLEAHSFRQTQTALTAYWFTREGVKLAYETPVAGYPWSIPFEFPIYQYAVAAVSLLSGLSVSAAGRLVSFACLVLCIPAVHAINKRLSLPPAVLSVFVALTFSTPLYVFWGRSVMIETAALLLAILAIKFFLDFLLGGRSLRHLLLFSAFMTLCMLQKITTGLPVLMVLGAVLAIAEVANFRSAGAAGLRRYAVIAIWFLLPLAAGVAWTQYADSVKLANPLGAALVSGRLAAWNWGTLSQRLSSAFWFDLIALRLLTGTMGLILGPAILLWCFASKSSRRINYIIASALSLGLLPLFLFANLHIVHSYYQVSNAIFLIYALAAAIGAVLLPVAGKGPAILLFLAVMGANYSTLLLEFLPKMTETFDSTHKTVAVGEILKREVPPEGQFVALRG